MYWLYKTKSEKIRGIKSKGVFPLHREKGKDIQSEYWNELS